MTLAIAPALLDAVADVEVGPGGLSARVGDHDLQVKTPSELARQLGSLLYERVHVGRAAGEDEAPPRSLREPALDERLAAAVPHQRTRVRAVAQAVRDGQVLVTLDGLRVAVPLDGGGAPEGPGPVVLEVPAARPGLSPGFFLVDGSAGRPDGTLLLRVYVHLDRAVDAAPAWGAVLGALEEGRTPYRAKISSSTRLYPRRDALVVYLGGRSWHRVPDVVAAVRDTVPLGTGTSPLVREAAPGVGVAWEPRDPRPGQRGLSFGEHRTRTLADALVRHAVLPERGSRESALVEGLVLAGVDPADPARNLDSPPYPRGTP